MTNPSTSPTDSGQPAEAPPTLSRREKFCLVLQTNRDYVNWEAGRFLESLPAALATGLLLLFKHQTRGQVRRQNAGEILHWAVVNLLNDAQFDELVTVCQAWLGDL